jgi:hypothetical protein
MLTSMLFSLATSSTEPLDQAQWPKQMQMADFAFIMFFSPACPHSTELAPAWEDLAEAFERTPRFHVASVDCTDKLNGGRSICQRFGVAMTPTLRYFLPSDPSGDVYEGPRNLESLTQFATELSGMCVVSRLDGCTGAQRQQLEPYLSMPITQLRSRVVNFEMQRAQLREDLDRAEYEYGSLHDGMSSSHRAGGRKQSHEAHEHVTSREERLKEAQRNVDEHEEHGGEPYRLARSVLLFRSHEQYAIGSGGAPMMVSAAGSGNGDGGAGRGGRSTVLKDEV